MSHGVVDQSVKIGVIVSIITAIIFGLYPPAARAAYADGANAIFIVLMSTTIRTLMLAVFCMIKRKPLFETKEHRRTALIGGFWQSLSVIGIIGGLAYLSGPIVMIVVFTHTLMLLFFMAWKKEITLNSFTIITTVSALVGLSFVLDLWHAQPPSNWIGLGLAFMAAIATVIRLYIYGTQMKTRNPAVVGAETFIVTTGIIILLALYKTPVMPETLAGWGWSLTCALSLGTASFGMFYGIALLGSFRWSLFAKIEPIFTALFSVLLLGEVLKTHQYLGILLVLGSLIAYQIFSA
ncbi:MAG TPA: hypothetical protein DCY07_05445, partial [Rhodospirillaceae bacterium]|nr:hypothetical protein [Rhodospirillaceae bacterium]